MGLYKGIIFDLGKVIFDYSFKRTFNFWATISNKPFKEIEKRFLFDSLFESFEKGKISDKQFREAVLQRLDIKMSNKNFDKGWCNSFIGSYTGANKLLSSLKNDYRIVALTNTNKIHETFLNKRYSHILENFQEVFCSHNIKSRKPETRAYKHVLTYLEFPPNEVIFIDDKTLNVKAAQKLEMKTILADSLNQVSSELKTILSR